MWLTFPDGSQYPQVYIQQQSPGIHYALISKSKESFPAMKPGDFRDTVIAAYKPLSNTKLQNFVRSISEPISIQQSMHHYGITSYGLLAGQSTGYALQSVLCGTCIVVWKAACEYLPRRVDYAMQVELACIYSFVQLCVKLWKENAVDDKNFKIPQNEIKKCFASIAQHFSGPETVAVISFISETFIHMLDTTCLLKTMHFIFLTFSRYGKFVLLHGPSLASESTYLVESTAPFEVIDGIANHFGLIAKKTIDGSEKYTLRIPKSSYIDVKSHIIDTLHYSITEQYVFSREPPSQRTPLVLRECVEIRPYQQAAWEAFAPQGHHATNGLIVLPCGAGKTLVGIGAICIVRRPAIVVCPSAVSVEQWKSQFHEFTTSADGNPINSLIYRCTSKSKDVFLPNTSIVLTTYAMLSANLGKQSQRRKNALSWISAHRLGIVVFDEVHSLPASTFQRCIRGIPSQCVLGLTATLLREDNKVKDLTALVGPKLYEATWWDLLRGGYIADVSCFTIVCATQDAFLKEYSRPQTPVALRIALAACNPFKLRQCIALATHHARKGDKVLIFADSLHALKQCQHFLRCQAITGSTPHVERMRILFEFQYVQSCAIVCISRVGDTSINLPAATVLIQISAQGGSRRQEMQRIGRLLRPKPNGGAVHFYSLVSENTHEERFAAKRRNFLVQQGYFCQLHKSAIDPSVTSLGSVDLPFSAEKQILDELSRLVCKWRTITLEDFLEKRNLLEDAVDVTGKEIGADDCEDSDDSDMGGVIIRRGKLAALSVDQNLIFSEYSM